MRAQEAQFRIARRVRRVQQRGSNVQLPDVVKEAGLTESDRFGARQPGGHCHARGEHSYVEQMAMRFIVVFEHRAKERGGKRLCEESVQHSPVVFEHAV